MAVLDEQGRVFGRINLLDAGFALVVLALVPLTYRLWALFRTPAPVIEQVAPGVVSAGRTQQRIELRGRYLRPYLRADIGGLSAPYLFQSAERAQIELPSLPSGAYDVTLFDGSTVTVRVRNAVTAKAVAAPVTLPSPEISAVQPRIVDASRNQTVSLRGRHFRPSLRATVGSESATYQFESAERVSVAIPPLGPGAYDLTLFDGAKELIRYPAAFTVPGPAVESITPHVIEDSLGSQRIELTGKRFQQGLRILVGWREVPAQVDSEDRAVIDVPPLPAGDYDLALFDNVKELARYRNAVTVRPPQFAEVRVHVRFVTRPETVDLVKRTQDEAPAQDAGPASSEALLESYEVTEEVAGTTANDLRRGRVVVVNAVVRVTAVKRADGWRFEGQRLRAGSPFTFSARNYLLRGDILGIEVGRASTLNEK